MKTKGINGEELAEISGSPKVPLVVAKRRREPSPEDIAKILRFLGRIIFSVGAGGMIIDENIKVMLEYVSHMYGKRVSSA